MGLGRLVAKTTPLAVVVACQVHPAVTTLWWAARLSKVIMPPLTKIGLIWRSSPRDNIGLSLLARKKQPEKEKRVSVPVVRLSKLPPFQMAALKLLNISNGHDTAVEKFVEAFSSDPALSADLLLVANSAEFGLRSRIATIPHAISFLGVDRVQSLATTIALGYYVRSMPRHAYMTSIWRHSIATAVIAELLGGIYKIPGLYTAGLTHDLGRLAMLFSIGAEYPAAMDREFASIEESNELEKSLFAVTHCEAGTSLAEGWNFPKTLLRTMGNHHNPNVSESDGPAFVIELACQLADSLDFPEVRRLDQQNISLWPERLHGRPELAPEPLSELIKKHLTLVA